MILDILNLTTEFVQYAADNVDHNNCTLDEHDTFHDDVDYCRRQPWNKFEPANSEGSLTSLEVIVGIVRADTVPQGIASRDVTYLRK